MHVRTLSDRKTEGALGQSDWNIQTHVMDYPVLSELIERCVHKIESQFSFPRTVEFSYRPPRDLEVPIVLAGNVHEVEHLILAMLAQAAENIGPGFGLVRVYAQANLGHVAISVEDNGRGFSEEILLRRESNARIGHPDSSSLLPAAMAGSGGPLGYRLGRAPGMREIRQQAEIRGGRFVFHSRLGVGTRMTVEFLRVDSLHLLRRQNLELNVPFAGQLRS